MLFGVQSSLVTRVVLEPPMMTILSSCAAIDMTASVTAELLVSKMTSTCCDPNHSRALAEPMSALFWWSAETISIGAPRTLPPKSSTAIFTATSEPSPEKSEYTPLKSVRTPSFTTRSEIFCAKAPVAANPRSRVAKNRRCTTFCELILSPPRMGNESHYAEVSRHLLCPSNARDAAPF